MLYEQRLKHETYTHPTSNLCGPCLELQMRPTNTNNKETHKETYVVHAHETYTHPTSNLCGPSLDLQMRPTKTNNKETHKKTYVVHTGTGK